MATTQAEKADRFRSLHERPNGFVIPNPCLRSTPRPQGASMPHMVAFTSPWQSYGFGSSMRCALRLGTG